MRTKTELFFRSLVFIGLGGLIAACNLYSKFGSTGSDEAKIEQALSCLHDNDYDCAIAQYNALADPVEKNRRLCQVNLARAGLTLNVLITKLSSGTDSASALGGLATAIMPWTQVKQTAVEAAAAPCDAYFAAAPASQTKFAQVLQTLSGVMDCAVRLAKADQFMGNHNNDTTCTTAGDADNKVSALDVSDNTNGTITAKGMCTTDANACAARITATTKAAGGDQNLDALISQLTGLAGLQVGDAIRLILRTKVAPSVRL